LYLSVYALILGARPKDHQKGVISAYFEVKNIQQKL